MEKVSSLNRNKLSFVPAITFLCLEILSFVAFSLTNSVIFYAALSLILLIIFLFIYLKEFKKYALSSFIYFLFPLVMYGLLSVLSQFAKYDLSIGERIFIPIALLTFSVNGYMVGFAKKFTLKTAMIVIYSAIAIYTLINLLITMIQFVPFYPFIYGNAYIYYDGAPSQVPLSNMAYGLIGFSLTEISIQYFSLFPTMLLTSAVALFHISFKEEKKTFLLFLGFAILGALTIFLVPSKINILSSIVIVLVLAVITLITKGIFKGKPLKITMISLGAVVAVGIIFIFLISQPWDFITPIRHFIKENSLLNKLFIENLFTAKYTPILADLFTKAKLFGFPNGAELFIFIDDVDQIAYLSGSWFFDNFMTSGLIGNIFFVFAITMGMRTLVKYFSIKQENMRDKSLLISFVVTYMVYSLFANDGLPLIFYGQSMPIFTQGLFMIVIFLIGYASNKVDTEKKAIEKEKEHEEASN